jgi:hypothetical protein
MQNFTTPQVAKRVLKTKIFSPALKSALAYYRAGVVVNFKAIGLRPRLLLFLFVNR